MTIDQLETTLTLDTPSTIVVGFAEIGERIASTIQQIKFLLAESALSTVGVE